MDERIELLAIKVREALEQQEVKDCYCWFNEFPCGSCMDASILLGLLLKEYGLGEFEYVSAENGTSTHSWIEFEGHIIDITADQFDRVNPKVMIVDSGLGHLGYEVTQRFAINDAPKVPDIGFYIAMSKVRDILGEDCTFNQYLTNHD